jgi:predicted flap endonuclease-1-like 5' DNA nuclease
LFIRENYLSGFREDSGLGILTMRMDYALYGLAIVLLAITAVTFTMVSDQNLKITYSVSTAVVGFLCIGGGYFLRPKVSAAAPEAQTATFPATAPEVAATEPVQQTAQPIVESSKVDVQIAEAPKTETPVAEPPQVQAAPEVEAPVAVAKVQPQAQEPAPAAEIPQFKTALPAPPVQTAISAPPVEAALPAPELVEAKSEFAQIRGISEKRAEQLKANGINTIQKLANASPEDLAEKLQVSPKIVKMWIGSAKKLLK